MEQVVGLDVSLKETHICVVGESGAVLARDHGVRSCSDAFVSVGGKPRRQYPSFRCVTARPDPAFCDPAL